MWTRALASDTRSAIPDDVFTDTRVTTYWDANHTLGTWLAQHGLSSLPILYDAYLVFDKNAVWSDHPDPIAFTTPILADTNKLAKAIAAVADAPR